jgi:hypothetical protein
MLRAYDLLHEAERPRSFYPIPDGRILDIMRPDELKHVDQALDGAQFLHLWNARLVWHGIDKHAKPPAGSWLERKAEELQITWTRPIAQNAA